MVNDLIQGFGAGNNTSQIIFNHQAELNIDVCQPQVAVKKQGFLPEAA